MVASVRFASESNGPESMAWQSTADLVDVLCTRTEPSQLVEASKQWGSPGRYVREVMPSDGGSFREMASGGGWLDIIAVVFVKMLRSTFFQGSFAGVCRASVCLMLEFP